jgi:hypothetical protein
VFEVQTPLRGGGIPKPQRRIQDFGLGEAFFGELEKLMTCFSFLGHFKTYMAILPKPKTMHSKI